MFSLHFVAQPFFHARSIFTPLRVRVQGQVAVCLTVDMPRATVPNILQGPENRMDDQRSKGFLPELGRVPDDECGGRGWTMVE